MRQSLFNFCDVNLRRIASDERSREEHAARTQMHEKQAGRSCMKSSRLRLHEEQQAQAAGM
jgi:hypothetical protein